MFEYVIGIILVPNGLYFKSISALWTASTFIIRKKSFSIVGVSRFAQQHSKASIALVYYGIKNRKQKGLKLLPKDRKKQIQKS